MTSLIYIAAARGHPELLGKLGERDGLLRAGPQLLPGKLRLFHPGPEEPRLQFRPRLQDGRVSWHPSINYGDKRRVSGITSQ